MVITDNTVAGCCNTVYLSIYVIIDYLSLLVNDVYSNLTDDWVPLVIDTVIN